MPTSNKVKWRLGVYHETEIYVELLCEVGYYIHSLENFVSEICPPILSNKISCFCFGCTTLKRISSQPIVLVITYNHDSQIGCSTDKSPTTSSNPILPLGFPTTTFLNTHTHKKNPLIFGRRTNCGIVTTKSVVGNRSLLCMALVKVLQW